MPKYRVKIRLTNYEMYEVEAESLDDAVERYDEGSLYEVQEGDGEIVDAGLFQEAAP